MVAVAASSANPSGSEFSTGRVQGSRFARPPADVLHPSGMLEKLSLFFENRAWVMEVLPNRGPNFPDDRLIARPIGNKGRREFRIDGETPRAGQDEGEIPGQISEGQLAGVWIAESERRLMDDEKATAIVSASKPAAQRVARPIARSSAQSDSARIAPVPNRGAIPILSRNITSVPPKSCTFEKP